MSNSSSSSNTQPRQIPIFFGKHYDQWVERMRKILIGYGLWDYVENGYDESDWKMRQENINNDAKALGLIKRGLSPAILQRIILAVKAKETWDILKREFAGNPEVPPPNSSYNAQPPPQTPMMNKPEIAAPRFPAGSKRAKAFAALAALTAVSQVAFIANTVHTVITKEDRSSESSKSNSNDVGNNNNNDELFTYAPDSGVDGSTTTTDPPSSEVQQDHEDGNNNDELFTYANDDQLFTYANDDQLFTYANADGTLPTIDTSSQQLQEGSSNNEIAQDGDIGSTTDALINQIQECVTQ